MEHDIPSVLHFYSTSSGTGVQVGIGVGGELELGQIRKPAQAGLKGELSISNALNSQGTALSHNGGSR